MRCIEVKKNIDAVIDGEATAEQSNDLKTHIVNCGLCRTELKVQETLSTYLKRILPVSPAASLDEKVLKAFQLVHSKQQVQTVGEENRTGKIGWFGVPRFAYAVAIFLLTITAISTFQLGKMSASELSSNTELPQNDQTKSEKPMLTNIVHVPVIQEKIVRVPVTTEKIITRTIYVKKKTESLSPKKNGITLKSSVENNGYLTQANLAGFRPVSEINLRISKEEKENEK